MEWLDVLKEYGGYVALPVVINAIMIGLKKTSKRFFVSPWGVRLAYFLPIVLGVVGGLLLPIEEVTDQLLIGSALGALSHYVYKFVTVTLASETKVKYLSMRKEIEKSVINKPSGGTNADDKEVVVED